MMLTDVTYHCPLDKAMTDSELLAQYVRGGSQEAFEELIRRHSAMVYSACLRILNEAAAAEDAMQATFLIFAQRAASLGASTVIGGWLYTTACNSARNLKSTESRRKRREHEVGSIMAQTSEENLWNELQPNLDSAVETLPAPQRQAIILRYFNGMTESEAARAMGCPEKTIRSRIANGLDRLRYRLRPRQVVLPSVALAALLAERSVEAAPAGMLHSIAEICAGKAAPSALVAQAVAATAKTAGTSARMATTAKSALLFKVVAATALAGAAATTALVLRNPGSTLGPVQAPTVPFEKQVQDSLVGHWSFDEENDVLARDESGQGHDAILTGHPKRVAGKRGKALMLDGVSTSISIPALSGTQFPEAGTLAFWININDKVYTTNSNAGETSILDGWGSRNHIQILTLASKDPTAFRGIDVRFVGGGPQGSSALFSWKIAVPASTWQHLAITWDSKNRKAQIFLNGTSVYAGEIVGEPWTPSKQEVQFGWLRGSSDFYHFTGLLDNIVLCRKPLPPEVIQRLYETQ